jgi:thiamine-phosphate pyrophosphorylase
MKGYYFITDEKLSKKGNLSDVKNAIKAGVKIIQFRKKQGETKELFNEALKIKKICKNATFIVNDRIDIALAVNADGVHLGQNDLPLKNARKLMKKKIIGVTVHNIKEAIQAEKDGANYLGVSPIYKTTTKQDAGKPKGIKLIKKIKKVSSLPLVAIGGINLENAEEVIKAGADCICAISAVVTKENIKEEIKKFQELWRKKNDSTK